MTVLNQDILFALRTLRRSPAFTAAALLTLALGIGANTAMFSIAHAVLWRSLPYPDPARIVSVSEVGRLNPNDVWGASYLNLADWRARAHSFERIAGVMFVSHILRDSGNPVRLSGAAVSRDFFPLLGVAPALGRAIGSSDDRPGAPPVIVLSHKLWIERFAGEPSILGRTLRFGDTAFSIIGVMPPAFVYRGAEFYTPLEAEVDDQLRSRRSVWVLDPVARLRPGVSPSAAAREVEAIADQIRRDHPETRRDLVVRVLTLRDVLGRDLRPALLILIAAVALVLLIACGNVAALMLVRAAARSREMAVRLALGGSTSRLLRLAFTESAILALLGGALGLALAASAVRLLPRLSHDLRLQHIPLDTPVVAFALAATLLTTLLFGAAPALHAARPAASALNSGSRSSLSPRRARSQSLLVVAEVALCLLLLSGAALLLKSFRNLYQLNPGFQPDRLASLRLTLSPSYSSNTAITNFYRRLRLRLAALPGLSASALASRLPITGGEPTGDIALEDRPSPEGQLGATTFRSVTPDYFATLAIPLVRGRLFDDRDSAPDLHRAIINQGFARRFWPNSDPIGKRFKVGPRDRASWLTIVGVVGDVRVLGLDSPAPFCTYVPLDAVPYSHFEAALRARRDPSLLLEQARAAIHAMDPSVLIDHPETMSGRIDSSLAPRRLNLLLFELFASLALLLSALGLYGVVAYAAARRAREFGIRIAVGAQPRDVLSLVLGQGLRLTLAGAALGLLSALLLNRFLSSLLFQVSPADPSTLFAVLALLIAVSLAACSLPAWRAARSAPVDALRIDE